MTQSFSLKLCCSHCSGINAISSEDFNSHLHCGHCNKVIKVPSNASSPGIILDDFLLVKEIGSGGMGVVYEATQISLERTVALKVLKGINSQQQIEDLLREARLAARLNHPNIVQAYAAGYSGGVCYFAMEYVSGQTISEMLLNNTVFSEKKGVEICLKTAEALTFAWEKEHIVHRDIKPDNIMLTQTGEVKLMDLGLSILGNHEEEESDEVKGTLQYISPEQVRGEKTDLRSDFYSLGCSLYQMLTGRFIFEGKEQMHIVMQHLETPYEPRHGDGLSTHVNNALKALCAKEQKDRPANAAELKLLLKPAKSGRKKKTFSTNSQNFTPTSKNITTSSKNMRRPKQNTAHATSEQEAKKKKTIIIAVALVAVCCLALLFIGGKDKAVPGNDKSLAKNILEETPIAPKPRDEKITAGAKPTSSDTTKPTASKVIPAVAKVLGDGPMEDMKIFKKINLESGFSQVNCSQVLQKGSRDSIKSKTLTVDAKPHLHGELQFQLPKLLAQNASEFQWLLKMKLASKSTSGSRAEFVLTSGGKALGRFKLYQKEHSLKPNSEFYLLLPPLPNGIASELNLQLTVEEDDSAHFRCESPESCASLFCLDKGQSLEYTAPALPKADLICKASSCVQINSELKKEVQGCVQVDGTPDMPVELTFELSEEMINNADKYHWRLQFFIDDGVNAHTSGTISLLQNGRKLTSFRCVDESGAKTSDSWHAVKIPLNKLKLEGNKLSLKLINASSDGLYIRKGSEQTPKLMLYKKQ